MARVLWWLVIALVAAWWWRKLAGRGTARRTGATPPAPPPAGAAAPRLQAMVRCAHCGLHLPEADALADASGARYCSPAHRDAAAARTHG